MPNFRHIARILAVKPDMKCGLKCSKFLVLRRKNNGGLFIMHLNMNSLQNKFEELKIIIKDSKALVVFLT